MTYYLKIDKNADKFLDKLPQNIAERIIDKLEQVRRIHLDIWSITKEKNCIN